MFKFNSAFAVIALMSVSACETPPATPSSALPEAVIAIASPEQDLSNARLLPEDNCYWYTYRGPVETTDLPLRSSEGRPICAAPPVAEVS